VVHFFEEISNGFVGVLRRSHPISGYFEINEFT
jgi:hypothetical protein